MSERRQYLNRLKYLQMTAHGSTDDMGEALRAAVAGFGRQRGLGAHDGVGVGTGRDQGPVHTGRKEQAMQQKDEDMLKVREYRGEWWLCLEYPDGAFEGIARFPNETAKELFLEWHHERIEGIYQNVMNHAGPDADPAGVKAALLGGDVGQNG